MKKVIIEKELLQEQLNKNLTKQQICDNLNISVYVLKNMLELYNLDYVKKNARRGKVCATQYTYVDKDWLIENWVNTNKSLSDLSKEFNIPSSILEARRAKYNVTKKYKYHVNTDKLFNLNDPNVYYLAGLIATDGYVSSSHDAIEIELSGDSELELLEDIKSYFDCTAPIVKYGGYRLRIACDGITEFFNTNFNINTGAKTFTVGVPTVFSNIDCAKAYIRGCFDGDGYIAKTRKCCSIVTASESFIYGIQTILKNYANINVIVNFSHGYPGIGLTDRKAFNVVSWFYSGSGLKLERKYLNYTNWLMI